MTDPELESPGDERQSRLPVPSQRAVRRMQIVVITLGVIAGLWLLYTVASLASDVHHNKRTIDGLSAANQAQDKALREANRRLTQAGETPVAVPSPGPTGAAGAQGETGATGAQGSAGPQGEQGPRGFTGAQGTRGPRGFTGLDGTAGAQGATGPQGEQGPKGEKGEQGPAGPQGPKGDAGATGPAGADGQDATCSGEFVCESELQAILADYAPRSWVLDLLRSLGCETTVVDGPSNVVITCTITGKP